MCFCIVTVTELYAKINFTVPRYMWQSSTIEPLKGCCNKHIGRGNCILQHAVAIQRSNLSTYKMMQNERSMNCIWWVVSIMTKGKIPSQFGMQHCGKSPGPSDEGKRTISSHFKRLQEVNSQAMLSFIHVQYSMLPIFERHIGPCQAWSFKLTMNN